MPGALQDQRVVVTGAAHGIGRALATRAAEEGARLLIADLDEDAVIAVAREIGAIPYVGDVASSAGAGSLVQAGFVIPQFQGIDVFFANAGIDTGGGLETDDATWDHALEVNVMSHVRTARALFPRWLEAGAKGRFVVTASAAGLLTMIGSAPYSVSKHAAVAFAEWLSVTYGDRGITVQAICPQGVDTRMLRDSGPVQALLSHDAAIPPEAVADAAIEALTDDRFLILPHPEVAQYYAARAADPDRWLAGMRKLQAKVFDA